MARPPKKRFVKHRLSYQVFGPLNAEKSCADENGCVTLTIDQLEAMRLADLEGMSHNDAAEFMKVSRQTFGRIIEQARQIVTLALINSKVLKIECDTNIEYIDREVKCIECGHEWMLKGAKSESTVHCPECESSEIIKRTRCGNFCECPLKINKCK